MKETAISRESARAILSGIGRSDEYDPAGDYWVVTDEAGGEFLWLWGDDSPMAKNHTNTTWIS